MEHRDTVVMYKHRSFMIQTHMYDNASVCVNGKSTVLATSNWVDTYIRHYATMVFQMHVTCTAFISNSTHIVLGRII